jgi:hypothetical protein
VKPHEEALGEFSESELAKLTLPAVEIHCWNPLNIAFRTVPGSYIPKPARRSRDARLGVINQTVRKLPTELRIYAARSDLAAEALSTVTGFSKNWMSGSLP